LDFHQYAWGDELERLSIEQLRSADMLLFGRVTCEGYCLKTKGGPLTRFPFSSTVTSTRSAILMKGMPLFIP
jgi:hypothetical protein